MKTVFRHMLERHLATCIRVSCMVVTIVLSIGASQVGAQVPLAEVARKEAERRKAQPPAAKVYTEKDLPPSAQKPAAPPPAGDATVDPVEAATAERSGAAQLPAGSGQPAEAWWRARIQQAREELRRNEIFAEALQSRINALTREYALPIAGARRIAVGQQRTEALNELARVKEDIERARKQIAEIEEEARRAGVPPGWLR